MCKILVWEYTEADPETSQVKVAELGGGDARQCVGEWGSETGRD